MDPFEKDEVPMLSATYSQVDEHAISRSRRFSPRMRSASISIPMDSAESYEDTNVGHTGPLRSQRRTPIVQMSGPLYPNRKQGNSFQPTQAVIRRKAAEPTVEDYPSVSGIDHNDWPGNSVGKNEHLLRSGQLGMCNDPYCTTCPSYYNVKGQQKYSEASAGFDPKFHSLLYGDAKGWAKRALSFLHPYIPGVMNPHAKVVQQWNKFFVISCLVAVFLDPLFFFVLSVRQAIVHSLVFDEARYGGFFDCGVYWMTMLFFAKAKTLPFSEDNEVSGSCFDAAHTDVFTNTGLIYEKTFALVAEMTTVRLLLSLAASQKWQLLQIDVNNAFLHGKFSETVHTLPPPGLDNVPSSFVYRLRRSLYRLKQAPRAWFEKFSSTIVAAQFHQNLWPGTYFLGLEVNRSPPDIFVNQHKYIKDLVKLARLFNARSVDTPMELNVKYSKDSRIPVSDPACLLDFLFLRFIPHALKHMQMRIEQVALMALAPRLDETYWTVMQSGMSSFDQLSPCLNCLLPSSLQIYLQNPCQQIDMSFLCAIDASFSPASIWGKGKGVSWWGCWGQKNKENLVGWTHLRKNISLFTRGGYRRFG
ncbi:hypothetical protein RJ640_001813 [Escallonia rubra]|uniref:Reverse transcriptase Ty1/copia-type domain-containing protein n=1 Tax=Escallonia rubra TaxID=112253 RepID=A0AA88U1T8_9ASTE|nr:hypothetical protein RJ640_001813 [Escallonia rubra]